VSTINELENFLLTEIVVDENIESLSPDDDLIMQGIIDSLGIMKLVGYLEDNFKIIISDDDLVPENFQTIANLEKLIEMKRQD
jgi:acyl carrier protein